MLVETKLGTQLIENMKSGKMPSADKIFAIAEYLEVSAYFLMGVTDDPTPPKKKLTLDEEVAAQYYLMTPEEKEQYKEYGKFLKITRERRQRSQNGRTEISSELRPEL